MAKPGRVCCGTPETRGPREWCIVGDQLTEHQRGIAAERARIVAWLRNRSEHLRDSQNRARGPAYEQLGSMAFELERAVIHVERGEHEGK